MVHILLNTQLHQFILTSGQRHYVSLQLHRQKCCVILWIQSDLHVFVSPHSLNLDKQTVKGSTALHYCCLTDNSECLKLLLRGKATIEIGEELHYYFFFSLSQVAFSSHRCEPRQMTVTVFFSQHWFICCALTTTTQSVNVDTEPEEENETRGDAPCGKLSNQRFLMSQHSVFFVLMSHLDTTAL